MTVADNARYKTKLIVPNNTTLSLMPDLYTYTHILPKFSMTSPKSAYGVSINPSKLTSIAQAGAIVHICSWLAESKLSLWYEKNICDRNIIIVIEFMWFPVCLPRIRVSVFQFIVKSLNILVNYSTNTVNLLHTTVAKLSELTVIIFPK